jgi:hypothetical protein
MACACEHCGHEFQAEAAGGHRLLCGSATDAQHHERVIAGAKIDASGLVRTGDRSYPIRVFQFMSANRAFFAIATMAPLGSPPTAGVVRSVANASRSPLSTPGTATPQQPCLCSGFGPPSRNTIRNSSRNGPEPATPLALDGAAKGVSDVGTGQEHQRHGI